MFRRYCVHVSACALSMVQEDFSEDVVVDREEEEMEAEEELGRGYSRPLALLLVSTGRLIYFPVYLLASRCGTNFLRVRGFYADP